MADYRVWSTTDGPPTSVSDGVALNLGMDFRVTEDYRVRQLGFWRGDEAPVPDLARLYRVESSTVGTVLAEATPVYAGTGWQLTTLAAPVPLTVDQWYRVVFHFPAAFSISTGYWHNPGGAGAGGVTSGPLVVPDFTQAPYGQCIYSVGAPGFPTLPGTASNYWLDVVVEPGEIGTTDSVTSGRVVGAVRTAAAMNSGGRRGSRVVPVPRRLDRMRGATR